MCVDHDRASDSSHCVALVVYRRSLWIWLHRKQLCARRVFRLFNLNCWRVFESCVGTPIVENLEEPLFLYLFWSRRSLFIVSDQFRIDC